ncbi:Glycosyltransferase [Hyphomicrobiales bacterium]|nr:Glycosyltransferase [Hyphomicrobiales bacterium]CAH1697837.1 Glycosyltransferase [Hyphomicrobiales bacterium]CAI0347483.1 Glycosyltransferase [Hyphomicrobiales bacterium]
MSFDILFVADPRFEGGTSTALAAEIDAAHREGLRCGLLAVKGPLLGNTLPIHPDLQLRLDQGKVLLVHFADRIDAGIAVIHHPTIFLHLPESRLDVTCAHVVLVLHHPRVNALGKVQYDLGAVIRNCTAVFGGPIHVAPISPAVRASVRFQIDGGASLLDEDWLNLIDFDAWPRRPDRRLRFPVAIGRHARPDAQKWPDAAADAFAAYPTDPAVAIVKILGSGPFLEELYGAMPSNWVAAPFRAEGVPAFLASLDFYVYYHSEAWSEAFGRTILEALAVGVLVILPPHFAPIFGLSAVYCQPSEVISRIEYFVGNPAAYRQQVTDAQEYARRHFDLGEFLPRLRRCFPELAFGKTPSAPSQAGQAPSRQRHVMMISTNGIGLGHLVQQLSLADRLPQHFRPVFVTMSMGLKFAAQSGYLAHYINYHKHIKADPERWNRVFAEELFDLLRFYRPSVVLYDGTMPFGGLIEALSNYRDAFSIWVRRAMWREHHGVGLQVSSRFDAIIEPGELAEEWDNGPTAAERDQIYRVPPVLHLDPAERLSREAALAALGLPADRLVVALQLGSENNFPLARIKEQLSEAFLRDPRVEIVEIRSPIGKNDAGSGHHPRHHSVDLFPSFRYSKAFDICVSAAGYNAFHESLLGGIPSIFVPNEAEEMDLQFVRAKYAEVNGWGLCLRRDHDRYRVREIVEAMLNDDERAKIRERCATIKAANGADDICRFIALSAGMLRTDRPIA